MALSNSAAPLPLLLLFLFASSTFESCSAATASLSRGRPTAFTTADFDDREVIQELYIDNPYHDVGEWGPRDLCPNNTFVYGIEVKYLPPGHVDETAVNGIKLYCRDQDNHVTEDITSRVDNRGEWQGMAYCRSSFVTGFQAQVLRYQGWTTDDVAVQNFRAECDYGAYVIEGIPNPRPPPSDSSNPPPKDFKEGEWSSMAKCVRGLAVCGIQTRGEEWATGDDVATSDIILFCCRVTRSGTPNNS